MVSNDHYLMAADGPARTSDLAMAADLTRSVGRRQPWLLMEHSTSAVNWQPRNIAKEPGEMAAQLACSHVARGSDGALFFQWRASRAGAEKFHSAMLPHAGTETRSSARSSSLGADLGRLADVRGSRVAAESPSCGTGVLLGAGPRVAPRRSTSTTASAPSLLRAAVARRDHRRLRPPRGATSPATAW